MDHKEVWLPELSHSVPFGRLSLKGKILWIMLLPISDSQGRGLAAAILIKQNACPNVPEISADDIPYLFREMAEQRMIVLYQDSQGRALYQITDWWKCHSKWLAQPSKYQPPAGWQDQVSCSGILTCSDAELKNLAPILKKSIKANQTDDVRGGGWVYFLKGTGQDNFLSLIKIGKTIDLKNRIYQHRSQLGTKFRVLHFIKTNYASFVERMFHLVFAGQQAYIPHTREWFRLSEEDEHWICSIPGLNGDALRRQLKASSIADRFEWRW